MKTKIEKSINDSINTKKTIPIELVEKACNKILNSYRNGGKILVCGNGGSAADAQHLAGEFVNKFNFDRKPLPCLSLTTDTSVLTSIANDYSYDEIFSKQVEAYGEKNDVFIGISTSGNSKNVIKATVAAKKKDLFTVCLLGKDGGKLKCLCDLPIVIKSNSTPRIQESHTLILHIISEIIEEELFKN